MRGGDGSAKFRFYATLRALVAGWPALHDIEVSAARLDDAFVALTTDEPLEAIR